MLPAALIAAVAASLAVFAMFGWPRRVTHRYELFVAAPPQTVWDSYFVHISKTDYRPGTRILDAEIVSEQPLSVRVKLQYDIAGEPNEYLLVYELYEPYARYRLRRSDSDLCEQGEFLSEVGGTRLRITVTGAMRGFLLPWLGRRRVKRNQRALKDLCEGRGTAAPRGPLPSAGRWEPWVLVAALASPVVPLPWQAHAAMGALGAGVGLLYLRRLVVFARRL